MNKPLTAPPTEIHWRYEPVPTSGRCLLLNTGGCVIFGPPMGPWRSEYIAWAPLPKRDKERERQL